jgi:hypothetical protein
MRAFKSQSVAGDRTSPVSRHGATVLSCLAQIAALVFWSRWALARDISRAHGLIWIALIAAASVLSAVIHECGRALIAWCLEMSLVSFSVGPFRWTKLEGKWRLKLQPAGLLRPGGGVGAVSSDLSQPRWNKLLTIASGPLVSLLIGIPAIYAVVHDDWAHYRQTWELVAFTGSFCVIAALLDILPFVSDEEGHLDGGRILPLVAKSPVDEADRVRFGPLPEPLNQNSTDIEAVETPPPVRLSTPAAAVDTVAASSPILPAWISRASAQAAEVASSAGRVADRFAQIAPPPLVPPTPVRPTEVAMADPFARIAARPAEMTMRPAEIPTPAAEHTPEAFARIATKTAPSKPTETKSEVIVAASEPEPLARTVSSMTPGDSVDQPQVAENNPFARIMTAPPDRNLPGLARRPATSPATSSSMGSAAPVAPPLAGAPVVTPLSVGSWTALPLVSTQSKALVSFSPAPARPASKGPSVPAAFARRARVVGPIPDDPFVCPAIEQNPEIESETSDKPAAEPDGQTG